MFPFLLLLFVFPWAPSSLSLSSTVGQGEEGTKFARFGRRKTTCPSKGIIKDEWGHCFAAAFEFGDFHTARREGEREGGVEGERGADGAKEKTKGGKRWSHEGGKRKRERLLLLLLPPRFCLITPLSFNEREQEGKGFFLFVCGRREPVVSDGVWGEGGGGRGHPEASLSTPLLLPSPFFCWPHLSFSGIQGEVEVGRRRRTEEVSENGVFLLKRGEIPPERGLFSTNSNRSFLSQTNSLCRFCFCGGRGPAGLTINIRAVVGFLHFSATMAEKSPTLRCISTRLSIHLLLPDH